MLKMEDVWTTTSVRCSIAFLELKLLPEEGYQAKLFYVICLLPITSPTLKGITGDQNMDIHTYEYPYLMLTPYGSPNQLCWTLTDPWPPHYRMVYLLDPQWWP